jgi:hypothetical protein
MTLNSLRRGILVAALALFGCGESGLTPGDFLVRSVSPTRVSARGGTLLTVTGQGFERGATVTIQGVPADAAVIDSATLEVTVPSITAGVADLRVMQSERGELLPGALTVTPLDIAYVESPADGLPVFASPRADLAAWDGALYSSGPDGLIETRWRSGLPGNLPVAALAGEGGAAPAVLHMAMSQRGRLGLCTGDAERPLMVLDTDGTLSKSPLEGRCERLIWGADENGRAGLVLWAVVSREGAERGLVRWAPGAVVAPVLTPALPETLHALVSRDFDGDGIDELAVAGVTAGAPVLEIWVPGGEGFVVADDRLPPRAGQARALVPLDVEQDGDVDLMVVGEGTDSLELNDGFGHFVDDGWRRLPFERTTGVDAVAGDINRDGWSDLVVATPDGLDRLYLGHADGLRDATPDLGLEPGLGGVRAVLGDFDADGDWDLATLRADGTVRLRWAVDAERP